MAKHYSAMVWDYVAFCVFLLFSIMAPLWSRIFGKSKQVGKADYVFAKGSVSMVAIMLSIARGTLGIRAILGFPSELYYRGSGMWETLYGLVNSYPIVCFIFVPVYFHLGITSVYQYLDLRFNSRLVRCLGSALYAIRQIFNLGISIYTPSIALTTITGIPYWMTIVVFSFICIFFTVIGGLKAAINADVIQTVSIVTVTLAVIIRGAFISGGPKQVYDVNRDNGRLDFFVFTGDPTVRVDTLSAWLGQLFISVSQFGCQQNFMQRYASLKSVPDVQKAMMSNIPLIIVFFSLAWITGMVIYSAYIHCDPLAEGYIQKMDEIMPFFVQDQLGYIPGFVGIFMAVLFNSVLCLNVSNLNSLATVMWEDFLSLMPQFKGITDKEQLRIIKIATITLGLIIMGIAFGVGLLSGVIESSMLGFSATSGPLLGVFILAMLVPMANWKGAATGVITSTILVFWLAYGGLSIEKSDKLLPTSIESCTNETFRGITKSERMWYSDEKLLNTVWSNDTETVLTAPEPSTVLQSIYSVSYMYYSFIGTVITVVIGILVSYLTHKDTDDKYDNTLLHPTVFKWKEKCAGPKPYFIKDAAPVVSTATTDTIITTKLETSEKSQINHGFDPHADDFFEQQSSKDKPLALEVNLTNIPLGPTSVRSSPTAESNQVNVVNGLNGVVNLPRQRDIANGTYRRITDNQFV